MKEFITVIVFIAVSFFMIGFAFGVDSGRNEDNKLIQECESKLPRNQHCEIIAVPVEDGE